VSGAAAALEGLGAALEEASDDRPSERQIRKAILKGLKEAAEHFTPDPTPTDGTVRGALAAFAQNPKPKRKTNKRR
jgi:hypothetical protein